MNVMGLDSEGINDILTVVAGILHLGNISFVEQGNYAIPEDDGCMYAITVPATNNIMSCSFTISRFSSWSRCRSSKGETHQVKH